MKNNLKPKVDQQYQSVPLSARSSNSQLQGLNISGSVMAGPGFGSRENQNQRWMSGFLKTPQNNLSCISTKPQVAVRSSSVNPMPHLFTSVQEEIQEDYDVEELLGKIEMLTKENQSLKDSNR